MLEVYLDPCTVNSRKVLAGLKLIGAEYKFNHIDYFKSEQKSEAYLKINPSATVPAAIDDDVTITDSDAILQYAAEINNSSTYPKDVKQRAKINSWLFWESSAWFPSCYVYLVENVVKPLLGAQPDQTILDNQAARFNQLAGILDTQLGKTKWLAGDSPSIADIAVASPMHLYEAQKLPLEKYPNLTRWMKEGIESLPAWQETQGAVDNALLPKKQANGASANGGGSEGRSVKATFNYTKDVEGLTELYFYEDPKAAHIHEPGDDPKEVTISDGWHRANEFSIDKEGFALKEFKTSYENWQDEESVRATFYPEVVEFIKRTTGAKRVLVFDHTIRAKSNEAKKLTQETNTSQRSPVMLVHCDYTAESGPVRVKQLLPEDADDLLTRRVAFINVWKPIHNVVEERPLAMCDVTSSPDADFMKLYLRYRDRTGENYVMRHSPDHKWYYFPKISPEQVILLKTYESENDGRAKFVGHSAFEDPTTRSDAPMRESVEIRTIAFF